MGILSQNENTSHDGLQPVVVVHLNKLAGAKNLLHSFATISNEPHKSGFRYIDMQISDKLSKRLA